MTPLTYTVEQVAELLGLGRTATYESVRRGEIPSVKFGRSIRVPRHALEELLSPTTGNGQGIPAPAVANHYPQRECTDGKQHPQ